MNEGLIIDVINFGINNKIILLFSKDSQLEKLFLYQPKKESFALDIHNKLDYLMTISYENDKKKGKIYIDIIDNFNNLRNNFERLILGSILCDLIKNSLSIGSLTNINYYEIINLIRVLEEKENIDLKFQYSFIILILYYLLINSGSFTLPLKINGMQDNNSTFLFYDLKTNQFVISEKNLNTQYLICPKDIFILKDFFDFNKSSIDNYFNELNSLNIANLNKLLFFLSELFNFIYQRKYIKSLTFLKYIHQNY